MCKFDSDNPITQFQLDVVSMYMIDNLREQVHMELAPCEPQEFLDAYLELDPDFSQDRIFDIF